FLSVRRRAACPRDDRFIGVRDSLAFPLLNPAARRDFACGLPLSREAGSLTPTKRLNIQLSKIDACKLFTPGGSPIGLIASVAAISPQHFQNGSGGGQSQYSDVELMSSRQQSDSTSTAKCCHFGALFT